MSMQTLQMLFIFSASSTPVVQKTLIHQAMESDNCITGLKADAVPKVQLVVKYPPLPLPPDPEACGCFLTNWPVFIDDND